MTEPEDAMREVLEHPGDLATRLAYASVLDAYDTVVFASSRVGSVIPTSAEA
jgi:hypothetical protein